MNSFPKISIVIPVYNVEKYITECLQSIMSQSYKGDLECIIVDDCSNDGSMAIVTQLIANYCGKIIFKLLFHDYNRGLSAARNTGTIASTGKYIYYLDSDDFIDNNTIEELYSATILKDYAIVIGNAVIFHKGKNDVFKAKWVFSVPREIYSEQFLNQMLMQKSIFTATGKLFRSDVIKQVKFREGCINEDTLLMIDLAPIIEKNHYVCKELPLYTYHYRIRDDSISHQSICRIAITYVENLNIAIEKYKDRHELVKWLKLHQIQRCSKILQNVNVDKMSYYRGVQNIRQYKNKDIKCALEKKEYDVILFIKYLPRIMWFVNNIKKDYN